MEGAVAERAGNGRPYVLFTLAGGTYALVSDAVLHLALPGDITPVPHAPAYVEGVASIRGRVTAVVDLRARFGFASIPTDRRSRLIVVAIGGREVALRVDGANEFATLADDAITPLQGLSQEIGGDYVRGTAHMGERVVMVLHADRLLNTEVAASRVEN